MNQSTRSLLLAAVLASLAFGAQAGNKQTEKMKDCNAQAKTQSLAGDARKSFMKTCLSIAPAAEAAKSSLTPQQEKMKSCNADAKTKALKGPDRKTFMKTCLSAGA